MRQPHALVLALLIAVPALVGVSGPSGAPITFGSSVGGAGREAFSETVAIEQSIGRRLDSVRVFKLTTDIFPNKLDTFLAEGDRSLVVSIKPKEQNGDVIAWSEYADAVPGDARYEEIAEMARAFGRLGSVKSLAFHHEPDATDGAFGTPAEFIAAYRNVVSIMRAHGPADLEFAWILTAYSFGRPPSDPFHAGAFYPGDDVVDIIGLDGYNWAGCRAGMNTSWASPTEIFGAARDFAALHPFKDVMIAEVATDEDPSDGNRKTQWIEDLQTMLLSPAYSQFTSVLWFHAPDPVSTDCEWWIDSSAPSLAAVHAMAQAPAFGGANVAPEAEVDVAMLVVNPDRLLSNERLMLRYLLNQDFTVRVVDQSAGHLSVTGAGAVLVLPQVRGRAVPDAMARIPQGMVIARQDLINPMRASLSGGASSTTMTIATSASTHPAIDGYDGRADLRIGQKETPIFTGSPSGDAEVLASLDGEPLMWVYEAGDRLTDFRVAPSCRIVSGAIRTSPNNMSRASRDILVTSLRYAMSC